MAIHGTSNLAELIGSITENLEATLEIKEVGC